MSSGVYHNNRLSDRIKLAWRALKPAVRFAATGQWEGYEIDRRRRRPTALLEAQDDSLDLGVREKLLAEARALCQTFGIPNRILRQFANYVVGSCRVQWMTQDNAWNEDTEAAFRDWSEMCDWQMQRNLRRMARLAVMSRKRDGDVFFIERTDGGLYTLEAIEADRVGNILGSTNIDQERIVGGVKLDARGRPLAYRVLNRGRYGVFTDPTDIPRSQVIHFWDSTRFDARRGVTAFHVALNDIRDLKETKSAAQLKTKLASKIALLVKNAAGAPMPGVNILGEDTTDGEGNTVKTEEVGDLAIQYMFRGDDMQAFGSDFPADSWFKLTELLIRDIAVGLDLPFEFVWNMAQLSGPGVRMMSKQAERTFKAEQDDLEEMFFSRVITRWMANEVAEGRLTPNDQMLRFKVQRPSHPSIDAGRDSAANLAERKAGVISGGSIAEERGDDIYDVHAAIERESDDMIERAKRLSEKHDIPLETALQLMGAADAKAGGAQPKEQQPATQEPAEPDMDDQGEEEPEPEEPTDDEED